MKSNVNIAKDNMQSERVLIVGKGEIAQKAASLIEKNGTASCCMLELAASFTEEHFNGYRKILFVGALGICVRTIAPFVKDKHTDPAVVCIDNCGKYAVSVLSGHIGGANDFAGYMASLLGAEPVITTYTDNAGLWALDTLGEKFGWSTFTNGSSMNKPISIYAGGKKVALILDIRDEGTCWLEKTKGPNVDVFYNFQDMPLHKKDSPEYEYDLIIAVTPYLYCSEIPMVTYVPKVLHLGVGCRKGCSEEGVREQIMEAMTDKGYNIYAIASLSTVDAKKDEPLLKYLKDSFLIPDSCFNIYTAEQLKDIDVPNPSSKALEAVGVSSVSEACAIKASNGGKLLIEKQKREKYTFALALDRRSERSGHIEIVGAGPGDPELISVKGKRFLEEADLILYAGSLVPKELTYYAKPGAVVESSASMNLEQQFALMKEFYDKGCLVVRLHTGDPCIYGAIQEQMAFFDKYGMSYHITPGISSFLAAAAELQSQFTIPEKVQTIILTRGEGRTAMPEKERLHLLARSQSTMCIFLSASVAEQVQEELLVHYPPTTPVAACYHLTWKDQKIFRGELKDLASIIKDNSLTLTTMIVVGDAIGNREGLSRLYADEFKHLFRK